MNLVPWMKEWRMLPDPGSMILCAVSGGRDSVCLLHYLHTLGEKYGFSVAAGHYNHHMRPTAQRDEDFVRNLCRDLNVPFYTDGVPVVETAHEKGLGVEEMGRMLRYGFLERTADKIGAQYIATAHHQGDQVETVLLNLLRGTGPEGLRGIPAVRGRLIRPLLDTPRGEIEAYLRENGLGCVEDETNESPAFTRNRLRQQVLPALGNINPAWQSNIARTAVIIGKEDQYLDELAAEQLPAEDSRILCAVFQTAPEVLRPRMLRLCIDRWGIGKKDITAAHIRAVLTLAENGRDGMTSLPGGAVVCRKGELFWQRTAEKIPTEAVLHEGENHWGAWKITVCRGMMHSEGKMITVQCDLEKETLTAGPCRLNERMTMPGSRGGRTLKRLLTEHGVGPELRGRLPLIRINGEPAGVPYLGTDIKFTPQHGEKIITITVNQTE